MSAPCWYCGEPRVVYGVRAQGKNTHLVRCMACGKHTRDYTTAAAADAEWTAAAVKHARLNEERTRKRIERERREAMENDPVFVAAVTGRFVRYGRIEGQRNRGYVMRAPVDGVMCEVNLLAFALWVMASWDGVFRTMEQAAGAVARVLHGAGHGLADRIVVRNGNGAHPGAKAPVVGAAL